LRAAGDEVEIVSLPWRNYARHLTDNFDAALLQRLRQARFDVLIQDELNHPSLFWLNRNLRGLKDPKGLARCPIVGLVHHLRCSEQHPLLLTRLYALVERAYLGTLDAAIYNSQTTRQVVEALHGASLPHVVANPAGDRFKNLPDEAHIRARAETRPLRVLFIGNLMPRKGLHTLLKALAQTPNVTLTVIGRDDVDPTYTRQLHALANDRVTFLGPRLDAALAEQLATHHILAVPSSYEGFGIVYLEAMSFGLPCIATTAGAAHEIVMDNETGFLIPPNDANVLSERLKRLALDRDLLTRLSLNARARFNQFPKWEESMGKIRDFLTTKTRRHQAE
jgi:glycosyltransferase involved in cell wall biosynthesis